MHSCWKTDPDSRPSFKQLKLLLYQDKLFPKPPQEGCESDEHHSVYSDVLGDTSMREKYKTICKENRGYLDLEIPSSSKKSHIEFSSKKSQQEGLNDVSKEQREFGDSASELNKDAIAIIHHDNKRGPCVSLHQNRRIFHTTNGTRIELGNGKSDIGLKHKSFHDKGGIHSLPEVTEEEVELQTNINSKNEGKDISMRVRYLTPRKILGKSLTNTEQNKTCSPLPITTKILTLEGVTKKMDIKSPTLVDSMDYNSDTTELSTLDNFKHSLQHPMKIQGIELQESIHDFRYADEENKLSDEDDENGRFIWKRDEEKNKELQDMDYYDKLRLRDRTDSQSTQYTGLNMSDTTFSYVETTCQNSKMLGRIESLTEVEEDPF